MPLYEYRCRPCAVTFELLRPMSRSSEPVPCPAGHRGAERVISLFAARIPEDGELDTLTPAGGACPSCAGGSCGCGAR